MSQIFEVDCSTGQTSLKPYDAADIANQQAMIAESQALTTLEANITTIRTNLTNRLTAIETWLAANPNTTPTGAQFSYFAHAVCALARLTLDLVNVIGQAT